MGNASTLYAAGNIAANGVAGPTGGANTLGNSYIAFGLTSFYGHGMYFVFDGMPASGAGIGNVTGPLNAIH